MKQSLKEALWLINKYSKKSVFFEYLKKLILLISLPLIIIICVIFYYNQLTINNEIQYSVSKNFDSAYILSNAMFDEISINYLIYNENSMVQFFLNSPRENFHVYAKTFSQSVLTSMSDDIKTSKYIDAIDIYSFTNDYIMSTNGGNFSENFGSAPWMEHYLKTGEKNFIISSDSHKRIYVSYECFYSDVSAGLIVFEVPHNELKKMLLGNSDSFKNSFYFLTNNRSILYSTTGDLDNNFPENAFSETSGYKKDGKIYSTKPLEAQSNITLLYINDFAETNDIIRHTNMLFALCIIIAILSPLFISLYVSFKFYQSVTEIISMLNVTDSERKEEMNEFTYISSHIADLVNKHSSIESELVQRTSAFKQAQSMALQTQLSPHFLFNTLNLVSLTSRIMFKGSNQIETIVSLLGELLTAALDTKNYVVTVREEIDYAKKYIEIQQIRYSNKFDIKWDIDEDILTVKTVKLILQPLIENSFFHGLSTLEDKSGMLTIRAKSKNETDMYFCVADNGIKIPDERLAEIRKQIQTNDLPHKEHIGLCNVNSRIKLVFGEKYGVDIFSDETKTSVYIHIPKS